MPPQVMSFLPLIALVAIMYFLLIRPQRKRDKEINAMRASLCVGDEIVTIGGIVGKIVKTKEDSIIIQVGADKIKFEMMKWSVSKVTNPASAKISAKAAAKAQEEEEAEKSMPKRMKKAEAPAAEEAPAVEETETTEE